MIVDPDASSETVRVLIRLLDVFANDTDCTPKMWLDLLSLLQANIFATIDNWNSKAQRDLVAEQLHHRLVTNLAYIDMMADGAVAGHA